MQSLFDTDVPQRITEDHVQSIWELAPFPIHSGFDLEQMAEFHKLANQDAEAAIDYAMNVYPDSGHYVNQTQKAERLRGWLNNPETLPQRHKVPTLDDCIRLADTETEQGRALAWLLGIWPKGHPHEPTCGNFGDAGNEEPGATSFSFDVHGVEIYTCIQESPGTEKIRHNFTSPATREQMISQGRWLLSEAASA